MSEIDAAKALSPSLAGADVEGLCKRLSAACVGHPHAKIAWPHRLLHEARDAIRALAERAEKAEGDTDMPLPAAPVDGGEDA